MSVTAVQGLVLLAVLAVMVHASYRDCRSREVEDLHWALIFGMGALLFCTGSNGLSGAAGIAAAASVLLMAADLIWDRDVSGGRDILLYVGIAASVLLTLYLSRGVEGCFAYASVPAMYILMNILYYTGIVRGGADAKCVIALASVLPAYVSGTVPDTAAVSLFPPALAVLLVAAVLTALLSLVYLAMNLSRHDVRFPQALMGYRMPLERAERSFVWPMTCVMAGAVVDGTRADDSEDAFEKLREAGAEDIWVTPIIPFIAPLTAAYAAVLLFGNPLFALI